MRRTFRDGASGGASAPSLTAQVQALFAKYSAAGGMWDFTDMATLYQDSAGTTPVTASGQSIGRVLDLSGLGNRLEQSTAANRPLFNPATGATFDGVNDSFVTAANLDLSATSVVTTVIALTPNINTGYEPYVVHGGVPWQVERTFALMYQEDAGAFFVYAEGSSQNIRSYSLADDVPVVITAETHSAAASSATGVQVRLDGAPNTGTNAATSNSTGNFSSHPIYFFGDGAGYSARGSARRSVVIGAQITDGEKSLVEQWVAA